MSGSLVSAQVAAALVRGDKIQAIKLIREAEGGSLKDALATVEAYAALRQGAAPSDSAPIRAADVRSALQQGRQLEAIKRMRAANPGMDLKSATQAVDALRRDASLQATQAHDGTRASRAREMRPPTVAEGDRGGVTMVLFALVVALAGLAWWWWVP